MLRTSLKGLCAKDEVPLPPRWHMRRPEELRPEEFLELTADLYGEIPPSQRLRPNIHPLPLTREAYETPRVWRHPSQNVFSDDIELERELKELEEEEQQEVRNPKEMTIVQSKELHYDT